MTRRDLDCPSRRRGLSLLPFLLLSGLTAGCDNGESLLFPEAEFSEIRIEPREAVIVSGGELGFSAVLIDHNGQELHPGSGTPKVRWRTDDPNTAQVSGSGRVDGAGAGFTRVTASVGGLQGSAIVIVQPVDQGVEFEGGDLEFEGVVGLPIDDGVGVRVEDPSGDGVSGVTVRFSPSPGSGSVDPHLVVTDSDGVARTSWTLGRRPGIHQVTASVPLPDASAAMTLGDGGSGSVLPGNHKEERNPQQKLRGWAKAGNPKEVSVTPTQETAEEGDSVQFEAEVRDQHGNLVPDVSVAWGSTHPDVASVNADGRAHARSEGYSLIEAEVDGVEGSATLTVGNGDGTEPGPAASLTISPANWTLVGAGDTVRLEPVAKDSDGRTVTDVEVGWSSDDPEIVSITTEGLVTAKGIGTATILAALVCTASSCEEITASSHGEVEEGEGIPDPERVTDLAANGSTTNSITVSFTEVDDGTGNPATYAVRYGSPSISWGSAYSSEVTIEGSRIGNTLEYEHNGLEPDTNYEFQLVAYRGTLNEDAVFSDLSNVAAATTDGEEVGAPASVTITPSNWTIEGIGNSIQLEAEAKDAAGNVLADAEVEWSSEDPDIATISSEGLVTAQLVGSVTIVATVLCVAAGCDGTITDESKGDIVDSNPPPLGQDEPVFGDHPDDVLIFQDDFDSYVSVNDASPSVMGDGPWGGGGSAWMDLTPGRNGTQAVEMKYGQDRCNDCVLSTSNQGDRDHFLATVWFRTDPGWDPASHQASGIKGWMLNHGGTSKGVRHQFQFARLHNDAAGPWALTTFAARPGREELTGAIDDNQRFFVWPGRVADNQPPNFGPITDQGSGNGDWTNSPWPDGLNDGQWHRFTLEIKATGADQYVRAWLDGILFWDDSGQGHEYPAVQRFRFYGNYASSGGAEDGSIYTDQVVLWERR